MRLKRDVVKARKAYTSKDVALMVQAHKDNKRYHKVEQGEYLKSWVYGGLDGIITTFAVVAGVIGAGLSNVIILILGFANLIGDGISMSVGDYLSSKSESDFYNAERKREKWEVDKNPKGEVEEMIEIYTKKGYSRTDAKKFVQLLTKNKKFWVDTMMHDELDLVQNKGSPIKNAFVTFGSFLLFGLIPLILFLIGAIFSFPIPNAFLFTCILSGISMFLLGSLKCKITGRKWYKSGLETLVVGGLAASAAYFIGEFLSKIF